MASNAAKAAHHGDGGDLRELHSGRGDVADIDQTPAWPQDRPIAFIKKHSRARFEIGLRSYDALRRVELRLRESNGQGVFKETGPTIVMAPPKLREIIGALQEAERALIEEGVLPS